MSRMCFFLEMGLVFWDLGGIFEWLWSHVKGASEIGRERDEFYDLLWCVCVCVCVDIDQYNVGLNTKPIHRKPLNRVIMVGKLLW